MGKHKALRLACGPWNASGRCYCFKPCSQCLPHSSVLYGVSAVTDQNWLANNSFLKVSSNFLFCSEMNQVSMQKDEWQHTQPISLGFSGKSPLNSFKIRSYDRHYLKYYWLTMKVMFDSTQDKATHLCFPGLKTIWL